MKKQCSQCKRELPATTEYFHRGKNYRNGLRSDCKECRDKYQRKYKQKYYRTIKGYLGRVYAGINQRCNNPKDRYYYRYGGRGIKNKFNSPDDFRDYVVNELGYDTYGKIKGLQIDRIDNDGHYERGNIRFVTPKVNAGNRG